MTRTKHSQTLFAGILVSLLIVSSPLVYAQEDDDLSELQMRMTNEWQMVKDDQRHHIKTYARMEDGKRFRSFKAEGIAIGVKPAAIVRMLLDFDSYGKWFWEVQTSQLLRKVSATEYYVYMVHRAPFGLPDRDVILHALVEPQTDSKNYAVLKVSAVPDFLPTKPPLVRMKAEDLAIKFTPLDEQRILIAAEGYVDPSGKVPTWAANFVQRSAPYSVALGALRMVQRDEYSQSTEPLPFPVYSYDYYQKKN